MAARFLAYLQGGSVPGSELPQVGAGDPSEPKAWRRHRIGHRLVFGNESVRWGGGVCFVDPTRHHDPAPTYGRAWLITVDQLADVWSQENRGWGGEVDVAELRSAGRLEVADGWYRTLLYLGELDGCPVATVTCADQPRPNSPAEAYRRLVVEGLRETWDLTDGVIDTYLDAAGSGPPRP